MPCKIGGKLMVIKRNLYKIAIVIALILMLVSTVSASRHGNGNVILKTDSCTGFVDFLKFPACGCDDDFCGCGSFLDPFRHCSHEIENCTDHKNDNWNAD